MFLCDVATHTWAWERTSYLEMSLGISSSHFLSQSQHPLWDLRGFIHALDTKNEGLVSLQPVCRLVPLGISFTCAFIVGLTGRNSHVIKTHLDKGMAGLNGGPDSTPWGWQGAVPILGSFKLHNHCAHHVQRLNQSSITGVFDVLGSHLPCIRWGMGIDDITQCHTMYHHLVSGVAHPFKVVESPPWGG